MFMRKDCDTQRVYRLSVLTNGQLIQPNVAHSEAGQVNSGDRLFLVIDSVRPDTKHSRGFTVPALVDGAGGLISG